jgi:thiol-disulfide isomerase/thioredoxin
MTSSSACSAALVFAVVFSAWSADAALLPAVSEELRGREVGGFQTETLDGRPFSSADLRGKPVIVNFFASWCPVCTMELKDLRILEPEFRQRGLSVIEVLVDPVETPDTVDEARKSLQANPPPFPVVMMTPAVRDVFQYEGFPATYFIKADGTFSTTLFGYQPVEQVQQTALGLVAEVATPAPGGPAEPASTARAKRHPPWEGHPLVALIPAGWDQWHPMLVHFPIALLVVEACFLCAFWMRPSEPIARFSKWLLWAAVVSLIPTIATGIRDAGVDLGPGSPFLNGLRDRIGHFFRLESSISLHVMFGLAMTGLGAASPGAFARERARSTAGRASPSRR